MFHGLLYCTVFQPPKCNGNRRKRAVIAKTVNRTIAPNYILDQEDENMWRLHAQTITVVDLDEDIKSDGKLQFLGDNVKDNYINAM